MCKMNYEYKIVTFIINVEIGIHLKAIYSWLHNSDETLKYASMYFNQHWSFVVFLLFYICLLVDIY